MLLFGSLNSLCRVYLPKARAVLKLHLLVTTFFCSKLKSNFPNVFVDLTSVSNNRNIWNFLKICHYCCTEFLLMLIKNYSHYLMLLFSFVRSEWTPLIDFGILNQPWIPRINPTWLLCIILFMYLWIWFGSILLSI